MIDAEVRSEERYSRLCLAYETQEEKTKVNEIIKQEVAKHNIKPEFHTTKASNGKEILVVEYHDDVCRETSEIFENILCSLDIKACN